MSIRRWRANLISEFISVSVHDVSGLSSKRRRSIPAWESTLVVVALMAVATTAAFAELFLEFEIQLVGVILGDHVEAES